MNTIELIAVPGVPMVQPGDDLVAIIATVMDAARLALQPGDVIVLAQKIVSKAEGQLVNLRHIRPSLRAFEIAPIVNKHPRHVEVVLRESRDVLWVSKNVLVVETHHGFVCANAGVDRSNIAQADLPSSFLVTLTADIGADVPQGVGDSVTDEWLALLPRDPDASARTLRDRLAVAHEIPDIAVVINDTHGRAFRQGGMGVALGAAGFAALTDQRGETDLFGYRLQATQVAAGDEVAAAASLVMGQAAEGTPVVIVRGLRLRADDGTGAAALVRPANYDFFRHPDPSRHSHENFLG